MIAQGVDISAVQGHVPAAAMKARGNISYAWNRCKVGNNQGRDAVFEANVRALAGEGIITGAYNFPFPLPHLKPEDQADAFAQACQIDGHAIGMLAGELPPAFDLEWPPPEQWAARGCSADQIVDWSLACLQRLTSNWGGVKHVVYSYPWFLQALSKAKNFQQLTAYVLWLAGGAGYLSRVDCPDPAKEKPPTVPGWGSDYLFWQWNGNGGALLPNGVDADFDVFRYGLDALQSFCAGGPPPEEPTPPTQPDPTLAIADASRLIVEDGIHEYRQMRAQQMQDAA